MFRGIETVQVLLALLLELREKHESCSKRMRARNKEENEEKLG